MLRRDYKDMKYIVIGLIIILVIMAAGFAAFSQRLAISGTANFDTNWNVYISAASVKEKSTSATGSASVTARDKAALTTTLKYPGDKVVYNITVKNDGSTGAVLDALNLQATNSNSVIKYSYAGIAKGDKITSGSSKTFTVTIEYDSTKTGTATEAQKKNSITLDLDFVQDDGSGGFGGTGSSNVVYRWTGDYLSIGDSIEGIETTTDPTTLGKNYYLKHEIDSNNLITASYVCFVTDTEYCLRGEDGYYQSNVAILQANETWFNNNGGGCIFEEDNWITIRLTVTDQPLVM